MPNLGNVWAGSFQMGKETTPGTAVAASRIVYYDESSYLARTQDPRLHRFLVGRRDNVLAYTNGPVQAAGSASMPMSAEEALELWLITVQGGATPTTPTGATLGRQWVLKPSGTTLDSTTVEWDDGAAVWQGTGMRGGRLQVKGDANGTNMVTCDLFGTNLVTLGSLTGSLTQRVPSFLEGWQTRMYCDPFGNAPGGFPTPGLLRNWEVTFENNLDRLYTADNTLAANRVTVGSLQVTAHLTFDAAAAQAITEFNNWLAGTKRTVRLEFLGPNAEIEPGVNEAQTINTTGVPTAGAMVLSVFGRNFTVQWNDSAANVKTAIEAAMAPLGTGYTVTTTGGPITTTAVTVTFSGAGVAARDIPPITLVSHTLTGGTTPAPALATTVPGYSGGRRVMIDLPGAWTSFDLSKSQNNVRTYELDFQAVYDPTSIAAMAAVTIQTNRATAY